MVNAVTWDVQWSDPKKACPDYIKNYVRRNLPYERRGRMFDLPSLKPPKNFIRPMKLTKELKQKIMARRMKQLNDMAARKDGEKIPGGYTRSEYYDFIRQCEEVAVMDKRIFFITGTIAVVAATVGLILWSAE